MNFFIFSLWFVFAEILVIAPRILLRKKKVKIWLHILLIFLELLAAIVFAYAGLVTHIGTTFIGPLLFGLYIAFFADAASRLLFLLVKMFFHKLKRLGFLMIVSNLFGVAILVLGMINMQIVNPKYITFKSSKLTNTYRIAFVSDLHVGKAQPLSRTLQTIKEIKEQKPDFTIIGGDLFDKYTTKAERKSALKAFSSFTTPVYYIYGNHEIDDGLNLTKLKEDMTASGITVLADEYVSLGSDLTLLGRNDISSSKRKKVADLENPYPDTFLLVADHQPFEFQKNYKLGVDLQLSGHTHGGQLFPLRWVYAIQVYSYGEYQYYKATLNVSGGASGWQNPLRTEIIPCEYDIITLEPKF